MGVALVGSVGDVSDATTSQAVTPTWGTGESRTAGNLLVAWLVSIGTVSFPTTPTGWTVAVHHSATADLSVTIYTKVATGGDAAPTFPKTTGVVWITRVAEFSGVGTVDQTGGAVGASSPITATMSPAVADAATGDLVLVLSGAHYSTASGSPLSDSCNNATLVETVNSSSSVSHYAMAYGIGTSNATPDSNTCTVPTTNLQAAVTVLASFKPAVSSYTVTATENVSASDTLTVTKSLHVPIGDASAASDTPATVKSFVKPVTDLASSSNTVTITRSLLKATTELAVAADVSGVAEHLHVTAVENAAVADAIQAVKTLHENMTENAAATDVASAAGSSQHGRSVSESVTTVDAAVRVVTSPRLIVDMAAAFDSLGGHASPSRSASETAAASDVASRVASFMRIVGSLLVPTPGLYPAPGLYPGGSGDTAAATDTAASTVGHNRSLADQANASDAISRVAATVRSLVESAGVVDTVAISGNLAATATEVCASLDAPTFRLALIKVAHDGAISLDMVASGSASAQSRQVSELVQSRDTLTVSTHAAKTAAEFAAVVESVASAASFTRSASDETDATDTTSLIVSWLQTVADTSFAADTLASGAGTFRTTVGDFAAADDEAFAGVQGVVGIAIDQADSTDAIVDVSVIIVLTQAGHVESLGVEGVVVTTPSAGLVTTIAP